VEGCPNSRLLPIILLLAALLAAATYLVGWEIPVAATALAGMITVRSHRADLDREAIIAVFHQDPDHRAPGLIA